MKKVFPIFQSRLLQHSLFWILSLYIFLRIIVQQEAIYAIDIIYAGLFHLCLLLIVYLNLYLLIPRFLQQGQFLLYSISLLGLIIFSIPLNHWLVDSLGSLLFEGYYFISEFSALEIGQFSIVYLGLSSLLKWSKAWFILHEKNQQIQQLEQEKLDMQLQALKAQINPHFLFNSINSIYALALDKDQRTPELVLGLSNCLRYMLYECQAAQVPLEKELNYISEYIALQQMRLDKPEQVQFEIEGTIDSQMIAPLLLIPILENGFKHGLKGRLQERYFHIHIHIEQKHLKCNAMNNKALENSPLQTKTDSGLGLSNLKQQLNLLYPQKHHLEIKETNSTFSVLLQLELQ